MNTTTSPAPVAHFYLRLAPGVTKTAPNHKTPPVGVVAFTVAPDGGIAVSASLVSRNDEFRKKTGAAIARGRLNSATTSVRYKAEDLKTKPVMAIAADLGFAQAWSNHFEQIDWAQADQILPSALALFQERLTPSPVAA